MIGKQGLTHHKEQIAREVSHSIVLLALTGSSVGGFLGMVAIATRALGH